MLLCTLLGVLAAGAVTLTIQPKYETRITFFVVTQTGTTTSPLQADEFAQRRINSYVGVVRSEYMAAEIVQDTGLDITPDEVQEMISTSVNPETVLMNVTVTDTSAERSLAIGTSIADRLDDTIDELENRASRNAIQLKLLSGPTLNPDPVSPREKLNLALGFLLGLGVGIAQALLRYQLDTSFRSRDQLVAAGIPYLGTIYADPALKKVSVLNPTLRRPLLSETIRQLRTNLRFVPTATPVTVLAVTSSVDGEGRSTTAVELASSFAELGRRVLLIDADIRDPQLGRLLGLTGSAGLSAVLLGDAKVEAAVQTWGQHGLRVLPGGAVPPNPSELLASAAMTELLATARSSYDVVLLDTSALLPVADGAVAASHADGVILLVRHGVTARDDVLRSVETLRAVDAPVLGAVLSRVPAGRSERLAARPGKAGPPAVLVDKSRPATDAATSPATDAATSPAAGATTPTAAFQRPSTADPTTPPTTATKPMTTTPTTATTPTTTPPTTATTPTAEPTVTANSSGPSRSRPSCPETTGHGGVTSGRAGRGRAGSGRTGCHRIGDGLRSGGRVRAAEGPRRAVIQLAAWLLVCLAAAWLLRRQPVLLASMAVAVWSLVPAIAGYRITGEATGPLGAHPSTYLVLCGMLVQVLTNPRLVAAAIARHPLVVVAVSIFVVGAAGTSAVMSSGGSRLLLDQIIGPFVLWLLVVAGATDEPRRLLLLRNVILAAAVVQCVIAVVQLRVGEIVFYPRDYSRLSWFDPDDYSRGWEPPTARWSSRRCSASPAACPSVCAAVSCGCLSWCCSWSAP